MRNFTLVFLFTLVCILSGSKNVFAQCGPAGLDPCMIPKVIRPAAKTVIKKGKTVRQTAAKEANKITSSKTNSQKSKTNKTDGNSTSIYDSLMVKARPNNDSAAQDDLFPLNNVIPGQTTESQMKLLGGKRNIYTDEKNGEQKIYYTLAGKDFWMNENVVDSLGIFKFDIMPDKWQTLGLNFQLSYNESVKLLENLGYTVESSFNLPKLNEIKSGKNTTARVTGTKNGNVPMIVAMNFIFDNGKSFNSPNSLFYIFAGVRHQR